MKIAIVLGVPCVTLRDNTERPETVEVGANVVCGEKSVIECTKQMMQAGKEWKNPYGDGDAREKIVSRLLFKVNMKETREMEKLIVKSYP